MGTGISFVTSRNHLFKLVDDGLLFRQAYKWDLESAEVAYMLMKVGSKYPHMLLMASADGDNFNSATTSLTTWFPTPTVTADGTYVANTWILGGSGVATPAGTSDSGTMYDIDTVLIPNVNFLLKFTNTAGRDLQVIMEAVYIENINDYS
jgi:hypothetical protein